VSRGGIAPLALTEDTAGLITRTVGDAAFLTDVIAGYDSDDPETAESVGRTPHAEGKSYTDYLNEDGLKSARIGVYSDYVGPADHFEEQVEIRDARRVKKVFDAALEDMERLGATIVSVESPPDELVSIANVDSGDEFNRDINQYLSKTVLRRWRKSSDQVSTRQPPARRFENERKLMKMLWIRTLSTSEDSASEMTYSS
jgi:Asp-tRNA(Asn)/Glu-tRNA(Gln) amidotransferase A subunit family amidase